MRITKQQIFKEIMRMFGISTQIRETNKAYISGKYKYYKDENIIIKESVEVEYIGGKYEKIKKIVVFIIEKGLGAIKLINKETKKVVINFTHKTEPLILV